jgi:hypothetical protein
MIDNQLLMKKVFNFLKYFLGVIFVLAIGFYLFFNEKRPTASPSAEADAVANKMMNGLNKNAWDSTNIATWQYKNGHQYVWNKKEKLVSVSWNDTKVLLNLNAGKWEKGKVFVNAKEISDKELDFLRGKAWAYFCNDSFWLIAPFKVFDDGTTRSLVKTEDGKTGLLVSYASGGVTPGDAYLWNLNDAGLPVSYKMWVKILPIGGVLATWKDWTKTATGVMLPTAHKLGTINIKIDNIATGNSLEALNLDAKMFDAIR